MATDNLGRDCSGITPQEIAHQMQTPVKQAGAGEIVSAINDLIAAQKEQQKDISSGVRSAVAANAILAGKLEAIKETIEKHLGQAKGFNEKVKGARTEKAPLSEAGISKVLRDQKPSRELKDIRDTITSKNTVHVKEKELRKLTSHLIKAIQSLANAIDPSRTSVASTEAKVPRPPKPTKIILPSDFYKDEKDGSSSDAPRPSKSKMMGDDGFFKDESKKGTKVGPGHADWFEKIVRAEAKRLFNVKDFRYAAPGEGGIQHRAFNEQLKQSLEGKSVGEIKKVVELEEGRIRNAKLFLGYEQKILNLRKAVVEIGSKETVDQKELTKAIDAYYEKIGDILKRQEKWGQQLLGFGEEITRLGDKAYEVGYGFNFMQKATEGVVANERKMIQEAGELAALQQTSAKHLRDQEIYVSKLSMSSRSWFMRNQAVARTGKKQVEVEIQQYKNQRKGIKDTELAAKLAEKGLALSTALGSNAEQTAETFRSWNMEMGLSGRQLGQMSIGMKGVANSTGLVGDELLKVVENTKNAMNNMRNLGTLTAEAATKLVEMNAEAQKMGVGSRVQEMNEFLTTGVKKFGSKLTPFMIQSLQEGVNKLNINPATGAEMQQQLIHGQLPNNTKGMEALVAGQKALRNSIAGGDMAIKDMTAAQLRIANLNAQAYGFEGIGELDRVIKTQERANRSYTVRLGELQDERKTININELDKIAKANFNMKESTLKFGEATKLLARLNEGGSLNANEAKSFNIQNAKTPEQKKTLMAETLKSYQEGRKQAVNAGADKANLGPGLTQADFKEAQKTGDTDKFLEKAQTADQQLQNEMINLSNPITQQLAELKHINSFLTSTFGGFATWITQNPFVRTLTGISSVITGIAGASQWWGRTFPRMAAAGEKSALSLAQMLQKMTHRGSIYTHDIHVESLLRRGGVGGPMNRRGRGLGGGGGEVQRSSDELRQARKMRSSGRPSDSSWNRGLPGLGRSRGLGGRLSRVGGGLSAAGGIWSMLGLPGSDYVDAAANTADYADMARDLMPRGTMRKAGSMFSRTVSAGKGLVIPALTAGKGLLGKGLSAGKGLAIPALTAGKGLLGKGLGMSKGLLGKGAGLLSKGKGLIGSAGTGLTMAGAGTAAAAAYGVHVIEDLVRSGIEVAMNPKILKERDQAALENMSGGGIGKAIGGYAKNVGGNLMRPGMSIIEMGKAEADILSEAPGTAIDTYKWSFGSKSKEAAKGKEKAWALDEKTFYKTIEDFGAKPNLTPKEQGMLEMAQSNLARMSKESGGKFGAHPPMPKPSSVETFKTTLSQGGAKLQTSSIASATETPPVPTITSSPSLAPTIQTKPTVTPNLTSMMGVGSIEQKIKAEEVNKNPDKASSSMVTNLSGVESNTAQSNEQLKILVEQIKTLVTILTVGGSEHGRPNAKSHTQSNILPNYYTWNTGDNSTLPSKGPVLPSV